MKFKLDENIPWILKKVIESNTNHHVDSVFHENLCGIKDRDLIKQCLKEQRILITHDNDFKNSFLYPEGSFYGIIILKSAKQGKIAVKNFFERFLKNFSLDEVKGKIIIVEEKQIRIR